MSDLISKSKLLNTIATNVHYDSENPLAQYAKLLALVNDAPTVEAERHGHWVNEMGMILCSECRDSWGTEMEEMIRSFINYCPNCGAKMDEVKND